MDCIFTNSSAREFRKFAGKSSKTSKFRNSQADFEFRENAIHEVTELCSFKNKFLNCCTYRVQSFLFKHIVTYYFDLTFLNFFVSEYFLQNFFSSEIYKTPSFEILFQNFNWSNSFEVILI